MFIFKKIIYIIIVLATFSGCAANSKTFELNPVTFTVKGQQPPLIENLFLLAPGDVSLAAWINVENIRSASSGKLIMQLFTELTSDIEEIPSSFIEESFSKANQILIVSGRTQKEAEDGFLMIIEGNEGTKSLLSLLEANFTASSRKSFDILENPSIAAMALTEKIIAIGTHRLFDLFIDNATGKQTHLRNQNEFSDFALKPNQDAYFRFVQDLSPLNQAQLNQTPPMIRSWIENTKNCNAQLSLSSGFSSKIIGNMKTANNANQVRQDINSNISTLLSNPIIRLLGIRWLKDRIITQTRGNVVEIDINLSQNEIKKIADIIEPIMRVQQMINPQR